MGSAHTEMVARYLLAWLGLVSIAFLNRMLRQFTYRKVMSELRAHQLPTFVAIAFFTVYLWIVAARWPITSGP